MKRIWDVIVGMVMIVLSLAVQSIFYVFLLFPAFAILEALQMDYDSPALQWVLLGSYAVLFNGIACFEYFRRRRQATLGGAGLSPGVHAFKAVAIPDSGHIAWAIFLVPRGLDRILFGKEQMQCLASGEMGGGSRGGSWQDTD
ncbi:MAG: hypothetical protein JXR94_17855 [Candidatus Hydrogenedentes bacterium]|nr:hypothetical protein [Candidatus Hydrogenedentota bacterium]